MFSAFMKYGMKLDTGASSIVFIRWTKAGQLIVTLYVDDLSLVAENDEVLGDFKGEWEHMFDLKYFGPVYKYIGIEFTRTKEGYTMSRSKYLGELVCRFEKHGIVRRKFPIRVNYKGHGSSNNPPKENMFYKPPPDRSKKLSRTRKTKYESGVGSIN